MSTTNVLTAGWLFSLILLPVVGFIVWTTYSAHTRLINEEFTLQRLIGEIEHLNDVLTMSARMSAMTGDPRWEKRYKSIEPKLDNAIVEIAMRARESYENTYAATTKSAYTNIIEMENLAFALARMGRLEEARKLVLGEDYEEQKRLYSQGLNHMTNAIQNRIRDNLAVFKTRMMSAGVLGLISMVVLLATWFGVVLVVRIQLTQRRKAEEALRFQATHDALTGILNRKAVLDILERELLRSRRHSVSVGIVIVDLDHFKQINDQYGHLAGDAVLKAASHRLVDSVRGYDSVGRFGGEEFLVVLPECTVSVITDVAERLRLAIGSDPVVVEQGKPIPVTASMGVATTESDGVEDMGSLIRVADEALYVAKRSGRNCVQLAPTTVPAEKPSDRGGKEDREKEPALFQTALANRASS